MGKADTKGHSRKRRRAWVPGIVAVCLLAYLVVALNQSSGRASERVCAGLRIAVNDTASLRFVTAAELGRELGSLPVSAKGMRLSDIYTDSIELLFSAIDKIEDVEAVRLTDGYIHVTVNPMRPVIRVFDSKGSYYVNRQGKRISADARYHVDVPVVQNNCRDTSFRITSLLPLVDHISNDSLLNSLVSMIKVESPTDVLLVPIIRGQVINFGTPDNFESKFGRISRMYAEVMPVKGWNYYDTLSVKWNGQVVATRRQKALPAPRFAPDEDEAEAEISTMLAGENVAPGQALPGRKAKNEKPIPANLKKNQ